MALTLDRDPIRLGMVGGGHGSFIGAIHRYAARLDGEFQLVAGALSSSPDKALESAAELGIPADRSYACFAEMAEREAVRPDGVEAVAVVTPNHMHFAPTKAFLEAGIPDRRGSRSWTDTILDQNCRALLYGRECRAGASPVEPGNQSCAPRHSYETRYSGWRGADRCG